MLDKLIEQVKAQRSLRRICTFFLAFVVSLAVMGSSHDIFYGSGSQMEPEKARTAQSSSVAAAQKDGTDIVSVSYAQQEQGLDGGLNPALQSAKLEEIVTAAIEDKKDSLGENKEDAVNEAEAVKKINKSSDKAKKDAETQDDSPKSDFIYSDKIPMSPELQEFTYAKCQERGVEYELVLAIIWRESRFNVDAVNVNANGTRDNGIMQINDVNRKWLRDNYGITDLMDPYQNIDAGTAMLGHLTGKYGTHNAMMAYQYGEGGMARRLKQGITTSSAINQAYKQRDYYRRII